MGSCCCASSIAGSASAKVRKPGDWSPGVTGAYNLFGYIATGLADVLATAFNKRECIGDLVLFSLADYKSITVLPGSTITDVVV